MKTKKNLKKEKKNKNRQIDSDGRTENGVTRILQED